MEQKILYKASEFNDAMIKQLHVEVYQQDELLDNGGTIEKHTRHAVKINGSYFFKHACQFVIRE